MGLYPLFGNKMQSILSQMIKEQNVINQQAVSFQIVQDENCVTANELLDPFFSDRCIKTYNTLNNLVITLLELDSVLEVHLFTTVGYDNNFYLAEVPPTQIKHILVDYYYKEYDTDSFHFVCKKNMLPKEHQ